MTCPLTLSGCVDHQDVRVPWSGAAGGTACKRDRLHLPVVLGRHQPPASPQVWLKGITRQERQIRVQLSALPLNCVTSENLFHLPNSRVVLRLKVGRALDFAKSLEV